MRILFGILLGILLCVGSVIGLQRFPQLLKSYPQLQTIFPQLYDSYQYNHDAEGKLLQTLEMLDDEEYKSTEGNEATLYQLDGQCKINLYVFGESNQSLTSYYFHNDQILRAYETNLIYPNGGFNPVPNTKEPFKLEKSYLRIMMPNSIKTELEFERIKNHFKPAFIKAC
ncbi:hypothetical protein [Acinetobacter sp. YH12097]|uniref:hypothetical protein n=1 Tax=Acinetobacter sp. YH12097 TaxID=2601086 RepID=UPI0015D1AC48|nr:hypothetical protein [Acinetobacter sp. YH12097]